MASEDSSAKREKLTFVCDDRRILGGRIDPIDQEILESVKTGEGLITIKSVEELEELARAAFEKFDAFYLYAKGQMNHEQAQFVRKLRAGEGYSWRAVARRCHGNHRFGRWRKWDPPSNQIVGMALCQRAAEMFGEDYLKPPWN